jgi:hypothetical protein
MDGFQPGRRSREAPGRSYIACVPMRSQTPVQEGPGPDIDTDPWRMYAGLINISIVIRKYGPSMDSRHRGDKLPRATKRLIIPLSPWLKCPSVSDSD